MSLKLSTVVNAPGSVPKLSAMNGNRQAGNRSNNTQDIPLFFTAIDGIVLEIDQNYRFFENYSFTFPSPSFSKEDGVFTAPQNGIYEISYTSEGTNNVRTSGGHSIFTIAIFKNDTIIHEVSTSILAVSNANKGSLSADIIMSLVAGDSIRMAVKQCTERPGISAKTALTIIKI